MPKKSSHRPKCHCIFCVFKCPECGSPDIDIKFSTVYKGSRYAENELRFINKGDIVHLNCPVCQADIETNVENGPHRSRVRILQDAIHKVFVDDMYRVYIDKDFDITCTAYRFKSDSEVD